MKCHVKHLSYTLGGKPQLRTDEHDIDPGVRPWIGQTGELIVVRRDGTTFTYNAETWKKAVTF